MNARKKKAPQQGGETGIENDLKLTYSFLNRRGHHTAKVADQGKEEKRPQPIQAVPFYPPSVDATSRWCLLAMTYSKASRKTLNPKIQALTLPCQLGP